jgi:hypothetical protein
MATRRPLVEGLKPLPPELRAAEEAFVYRDKPTAAAPVVPEPTAVRAATKVARVPFTTRLRVDLADAVKTASLKRQLEGVEPNQVQEILESALEPWLRANGYLT